MIRAAFLAGLLCASAVPAMAGGDPAAVAAVEQYLRDDEKAMLAAVLSDKNAAAEFNADVKFAGTDQKVMKLVLDKWRGRVVAYAEQDARIANPDLEGTYPNYGALMSPRTKAYLVRRLKTMKESDRNSLISYLDAVDSALADNDGHLTWYTKKVVAGIFDKYREDLGKYLPEPIAQGAKASAPAAAQQLAELRKAAETPPPAVVVKPPPKKDPVVVPPVVSTKPARGGAPTDNDALEQARRAAEAAERSGGHFDGGGSGSGVVAGPVAGNDGSGAPRLPPSTGTPGDKPSIVGDVPSPGGDDELDDFRSSIKKMKTGSGPLQPRQYLPGALGALVGGLLGFFLGGPIGAVIGAGLGVIAGDIIGSRLFK